MNRKLGAFLLCLLSMSISTGCPILDDDDDDSTPAPAPAPAQIKTAFNGSNLQRFATANDGSGKVYVAGTFTAVGNQSSVGNFTRLNADGFLDTTFAQALGSGFNARTLGVDPSAAADGDVYVVGSFTAFQGATVGEVVRLNSDGSRDTAFTGSTFTGGASGTPFPVAAAEDGSNDVYVGGDFTSYGGASSPNIVRLDADGTRDTGFAVGTGFNGQTFDIEPLANGTVYVAGDFTTYQGGGSNHVARLTAGGALDGGFSAGTGVTGSPGAGLFLARIPSSTSLYVCGNFQQYNGAGANSIVRITSAGARDVAFNSGTGLTTSGGGPGSGTCKDVIPVPDGSGNILVLGVFDGYSGTATSNAVLLNSTGGVVQAFAAPNTFAGTNLARTRLDTGVYATGSSTDFTVGGSFTAYRGTNRHNYVRLNADLTVDGSTGP